MLRIPFILSILAAVMLLVACPPVNPPPFCETNPDADECQPPTCLDEPEGCQDPKTILETTLKQPTTDPDYAIYTQGEEFNGSMILTLDDPDNTINEAVVFLNVVKCVAPIAPFCKEVDQIDIRTVFDEDNSSFEPDINKKLYQGTAVDDLRDGVITVLDAKLIGSVAIGTYALSVQVFNCAQTDPEKVFGECGEELLIPSNGPRGYRFQVTKK